MRARLPFVLALMLVPAASLSPALALSPNCDQCSDLPELENALWKYETLMRFYQAQAKHPTYSSNNEMDQGAADSISTNSQGSSGGMGSKHAEYTASLFTDWSTPDCKLKIDRPVIGPDGKVVREQIRIRDEHGNIKTVDGKTKTVEEEISEKDAETAHYCPSVGKIDVAHEKIHIAICKAQYAKPGGVAELGKPKFHAQDEAAAYTETVKQLRKLIAALANKCSWSGSVRKYKPGGFRVVPTPEQVEKLKNSTASKAKSLRHRTK